MIGYLIIVILMVLWYALCKKPRTNYQKYFLIGMAVIMTLFYGLRASSVGSDTISYIDMFQKDGLLSLNTLWEYMWEQKSPAYVLCEWLVYWLLPYPRVWLIITSAVFFGAFSYFLYHNSEDPFYSYYLFFTIFGTFQMTGLRQSIAMVFLMFAFEQIKRKKLIKYLLHVGAAYLFHRSAIVFLPMYLLMKRKVHRYDLPVLIALLVPIYMNRSLIFNSIKMYTSYYYFGELNHGEPINFSIMIYAATLLGFFLCILLQNAEKKQSGDFQFDGRIYKASLDSVGIMKYMQYTNSMYIACLFMPLVAVNGSIRRIVMYFALFIILLIPKGLKAILTPSVNVLVRFVLAVLLLYLLISGTSSSSYYYTLCF